jgi:hypothetical protein
MRDRGNSPLDFVEANRPFQKVEEDDAFPFSVDKADGGFDRAAWGTIEARVPRFGHDGILFDTSGNSCAYRKI